MIVISVDEALLRTLQPACSRGSPCPQRASVARPAWAPAQLQRCRRRRRSWVCLAAEDANQRRLNQAALTFQRGLQEGVDEDELVARELGLASPEQMTNLQEKYKDKITAKLQERADELRRELEAKLKNFEAGKSAYARGQYPQSVRFFTMALDEEGPFSQYGGDIQLWLGLAYQACGREEDCLELYRTLEKTHPTPSIKKRAAQLRYILEAPKLEISEDEKVKLPILTNLERNKKEKTVSRPRPPSAAPARKREKTLEERFWDEYVPPTLIPNKYVLVAAAVTAAGLAVYSAKL